MLAALRSQVRLRPIVAGVATGLAVGGGYWTARCQAQGAVGRWTWPADAAKSVPVALIKVKVASYNILSDSLCRPDQFTHCAAEDIDNVARLEKIKARLVLQMEAKKVICLQEVSRAWASELAPLFEKYGYNHMDGLSGSGFSGYMGCTLAWPIEDYSCENISVKRVADIVDWPRSQEKRAWTPERPPFDARKEALKRHNCVVIARLQSRDTGRSFCVACYHMPCLFGTDEKCQTMVLHASWLMQYAQRWADGAPLIVAGDFNIQPGDPTYNLIADGMLSADHPQYPKPAPPEASEQEAAWTPGAEPMRSAYAVNHAATSTAKAGGGSSPREVEPEFTNYAWTPWGGTQFCETLDYIWLSPEWHVDDVVDLPSRSELTVESFPSQDEPSDHMLIGATLSL